MPLTSLLARTYLRYLIPVTLLSALAFLPLLWLGARIPIPADAVQARGVMRTAWLLVGMSLVPLLVLVGGVAPAVRSIAEGAPASQLAALRHGLAALLRAVVPCAVAVLAIVVGSLALVIPGVLLLVLLSLTGASGADLDLATRLARSVTAARARFAAVAAILVVGSAITVVALYVLQRGLPIPLPKQPSPELMQNFRLFARYAITGVTLVAPIPAIALAALAVRGSPSART